MSGSYKVVHVCTYTSGGATTAALRLHTGLLEMGIDSKVLFLSKELNDSLPENCYSFKRPQSFFGKLALRYRKWKMPRLYYPDGVECVSYPKSIYDIDSSELIQSADIVNLHWVAGFLDYERFFKRISKPIFWTLHDMNPFLGLFHYNIDYERNEEGLRKWDQKALELKQSVFNKLDKNRIHVVSPSEWLRKKASESFLQRFSLHHIPYGVPQNVFYPLNKADAKEALSIEKDKKVLLFSSFHANVPRKGFDLLLGCLQQLKDDSILLVVVGDTKGIPGAIINDKSFIELGFVTDQKLMNTIYNASDFLILPTLEDNLPNAMLESLSSGTPVIGFDSGGVSDAIADGTSGYLVKEKNERALLDTIKKSTNMSQKEYIVMRENCIRIAQKYHLKNQANCYHKLYLEAWT